MRQNNGYRTMEENSDKTDNQRGIYTEGRVGRSHFKQHAHQVPSNQPKVQVFVCSALPTADPQLRLPQSVFAATATTVATLISRMNLAPVSIAFMMLHVALIHCDTMIFC
ncbi:hypothetical protein ATANTOWER_002203 [Ataeniobius toweri]|uniref:Uncharacterized protein n=1 Tax=Ataeniobius toweri TaxID=208326 RepID=A0ABU7B6R3_9TELE|nr:hypothetical protein [Ataeniobius toweri]